MSQRQTGVAVLVASLLALGVSGFGSIRWYAFAHCQAKVNDQLIAVLQARNEAADRRADAFDHAIDVVLDPKSTPEQRRIALQDYQRLTAEQRQARTEHPYPKPPTETCR